MKENAKLTERGGRESVEEDDGVDAIRKRNEATNQSKLRTLEGMRLRTSEETLKLYEVDHDVLNLYTFETLVQLRLAVALERIEPHLKALLEKNTQL